MRVHGVESPVHRGPQGERVACLRRQVPKSGVVQENVRQRTAQVMEILVKNGLRPARRAVA